MKCRKLIAAAAAAALAVTAAGCSDSSERAPEQTQEVYVTSAAESADDNGEPQYNDNGEAQYDNEDITFTDGATRLSMSDGTLTINRRSRSSGNAMAESGWTILVYLCGSDLESDGSAATEDIIEAISAQYSDDVRIVYQTGGTNQWSNSYISSSTIQRWVNVDGDIELADEIPDADMGSADTLADFVSWGIENYPAKRMGLVFWNHGGGSISGVCFDEKHDSDSLSLREIDTALNSVFDSMTDKFEFIGFDACLMSTMETANILVPYARYMYASEETEPGGGWNYTDIMNYLAQNPDADGSQLGEFQCGSYYRHCIDNGDSNGTTFAITDLSKLDALLTAFDNTAKELYEYNGLNEIARAVSGADNFGGNNRTEGYTNMVDLKGMLTQVQSYAPSAAEAINALEAAVIYSVNGPGHTGAGGLSLYYPLYFDGSEELSIFSDICTSAYYLALVDAVGYGSTGADVSDYSNDDLFSDLDDFWGEYDYSPDYDPDTTSAGGADTISGYVYFDGDGIYTVQLDDMSAFNYATCSLFMMSGDAYIYLGEDDEVKIDYDNMVICDNFDGQWPSIDGQPLAITAVSVTPERSVYTAPVMLNGEQTNLRIEFDWSTYQWSFLGTWEGIDADTGAASRDTLTLKEGDIIEPGYLVIWDDYTDYIYGDPLTYTDSLSIEYSQLPAWDYDYSMTLYDVYGNYYYTDSVTFTCTEDGGLYFYPEELE